MMRAIVLLGSLLLAPLTAWAQALDSEPVDRIVAVVDEEVILRSELDRAMANVMAQFAGRTEQLPPRAVIERQVLERMILLRVQTARAEATGIRVSDTEVDQAVVRLAQQNQVSLDQLRASLEKDGFSYEEFRKTIREEMMIQRLKQRFVQSRVQVSDTEIDILLASGGLKRGEVRLSHILIGVPEGANNEQIQQAREKAERVRREIDGGLDFAAAAVRFSEGQQALEGGDLGWRRYDEVPDAFVDLIAALKKGEVTQPMRGPSGFHILKLVDTREQAPDVVREYSARHIMISPNELVSADEAFEKAQQLRKRIVEGGEDFAALAKEFSDDKTTSNAGGDMGWFVVDAYGSRVAQELERLQDQQVSEPFRTEAGWHVLQRLATRERDKTQERTREQAREAIRNRKAEEEFNNFLRQLKAEAFIENRLAADSAVDGQPQ